MSGRALRIGLLINPVAGIGGPVALKGSDGVVEEARARGGESHVHERVAHCLDVLISDQEDNSIAWFAAPGEMGADLLRSKGQPVVETGSIVAGRTTAQDTRRCIRELADAGIDLLLFAGGDGTARDVMDSVAGIPAVVGIPSGVKMHSGVFANTPKAAALLIRKMLAGELLTLVQAEVRDIDEVSFREGIVRTRFYGELPVPDDLQYMQQTKIGGREVEELVIEEIAADVRENMQPDTWYIMGSGSTIAGIMESIVSPQSGLAPTLLGIDVVRNGEQMAADVTEQDLLELLADGAPARIFVTAISGQGHILGRGNQQLSPRVIRRVGAGNISVVASKAKLNALNGRPLRVDTGDELLDAELAGLHAVITGYEDRVYYRVA